MTFFIVGASSFGRETLDAIYAGSPERAAEVVFLDDNPPAPVVDDRPVRPIDWATSGEFVIAIANPGVRRKLAERLTGRGLVPGQVIHPRATVASRTVIGPGCILHVNTFVSTRSVLGAHTHLFHGSVVSHDCAVGDYVTVLPGVNIAGAVTIEDDVTFGTNSCIIQNLKIGAGTMIGAGAAVIRDQPAGVVVAGVPSRVLH